MVNINKKMDAACGLFMLLASLFVICIRFVSLSNNLIFSDEGWYLCLLRDLPRLGVTTRFHLLFHNIFNNNIYAIRITCLILQLLASAFMAFGMALWSREFCQNTKTWSIFILLFCALLLMQGVEACPSFNYINLNKACMEFSVGFLFIGLAKQKAWYYLMAGFFIAFLFPIMITNTVIIPVVSLVILLLSKNRKRDILMFCCGMISFAVYYLVFVESPQEIVEFIVSETKSTIGKGEGEYGVSFLLTWGKNTLAYLIKFFIISVLIYGVYKLMIIKRVVNCNRAMAYALFGVLSALVLFYLWKYLPPVFFKRVWGDLFWIFLFFLMLVSYIGNKEPKSGEMVLALFLTTIPVALSFGTNVPFNIRGQSYFIFVVPLIVLYTLRRGLKWKILLMMFFAIVFVLFLTSLHKPNWHGEKLFDNQVSVKTIGIKQNVKLSERYIVELMECKSRIPLGKVLCDHENWGAICLLDYQPVSYEYDLSRKNNADFQRIVDDSMEGERGMWVVVRQWNKPFLEKLKSLEGYDMKMESIQGTDNIYIYISPIEGTVVKR